MAYVLFAFLLFSATVITHILYCRHTSRPGLQARACVFIAFIFIAIYVAGVYVAGQGNFLDPHSFWGLPFKIAPAIIFILLVPVYLTFYVLTQLMSPSKKILLSIARRGSMSFTEIVACIDEEKFIDTRLDDLCLSGCVTKVEDRYLLSASGQKIAQTLNLMQQVMGRDMGG